jgi:hypothetical protein
LLKAHAERDGIILTEEALVEIGRSAGAAILVFVGQEVLHQRSRLPVVGIGSLHSMDECDRHGADEVRVFAHRLLGAAPARIAAQVGVGRTHHDSAEIEDRVLVVVTRLFSLERADLLHQRGIPCLAQALFLRKGRGGQGLATARPPQARAAEREAVQAFRFVG